MSSTAPPPPGIDTFHKERSKCVDAFAELEDALLALLDLADLPVKNDSFGLKLARLAKAKPSPQLSKTAIAKIPDLLKRCGEISGLRNDIVHARLRLALIGDEHKACFVNLRESGKDCQAARLVTLPGLRSLAKDMLVLAAELRAVRA